VREGCDGGGAEKLRRTGSREEARGGRENELHEEMRRGRHCGEVTPTGASEPRTDPPALPPQVSAAPDFAAPAQQGDQPVLRPGSTRCFEVTSTAASPVSVRFVRINAM